MPRAWNDWLALLVLLTIPGLWIGQGLGLLAMEGPVTGALILNGQRRHSEARFHSRLVSAFTWNGLGS